MKIKIKSKHRLTVIISICSVIILALVGFAIAKYITDNQAQELISSRDFCFESNYLSLDGGTYTVNGNEIELTFSNNDGLTVAEDNLQYELTVSEGGSLNLDSGTLPGNNQSTNKHILSGSGEVTVTAKVTGRFTKTITATFNFEDRAGHYSVTNGQRYVQIDVYTEDAVSGVTVNGTDGLLPDTTNELFNGKNIGTLEGNSHYTFVYFKTSDVTYQTVENEILGDTITLN